MKEAEFLEEEEDFLGDETDDEAGDDAIDADDEEFTAFFDSEDDEDFDPSRRGQGTNRVNARRALEDYFEEKLRREEENYFDEFSIPLDDD